MSVPLRSVALFEAAKGALVLLTGLGIAAFAHTDVQHFAERLVAHLHLNPARTVPRIFLGLAQQTASARMWLLAMGAVAYALVRFSEAYGLWYEKRWAKLLAAASGAIYLPFEAFELASTHSGLAAAALLLNAAIVVAVLRELRRRGAG